MSTTKMRTQLSGGIVALASVLVATSAFADESEAERLFRQGRALMLEGQVAEACPMIAASNNLEPRLGTLLNLAACHEQLGKVATAWVELQRALAAAEAEGQTDRARFARQRIAALEPRLPWLTIVAPSRGLAEGTIVVLDDAPVDALAFGRPLPADPGNHVITATSTRAQPREGRFALVEGEHLSVAIPAGIPDLPNVVVEETRPGRPTADAPHKNAVLAYASLIHPVATNFDAPYVSTRFGLDLIYGRAGELDGGLQVGTVNLVIGKPGVATGAMSGVQLAPFFGVNYASGHAGGLQIAFLGNGAGDGVEGGQVSLGANVAAGDVDGAQLSWVANVATGKLRGLQFGGVNVAGDVAGAQVGFVNVAKKFDGLAIGLVNIADDIDGVPIGLLSVTKSGGVHPVVWSSTSTYANIGLKFATKHTYTMLAGHYTNVGGAYYAADGGRRELQLEARDFFGGGFFIGGHVPIDNAFIDFDIGLSGLGATTTSPRVTADGLTRRSRDILVDPRVRILAGFALAKHASLFGGAGLVARTRLVNDAEDAIIRFHPELIGGIQF